MRFAFIDATPLRADEVRRIAPALDLELASLPTGSSAASPDPALVARGQVLAFASAHGDVACVAEATDLLTTDGKSLRLELDSENARRFCRHWRETPARLHLCVALRRLGSDHVEVFTATCDGTIAEKPAGPEELGWDRLFVPDGETLTLAQLVERGNVAGPRPGAYSALSTALAAAP
ncbi:MAG TPA: non-canonical purine NTP pyrophosphatase [Kofleriaceae bacterium]|nr:non-canonical purine NTP pyrophosphatase [Kofleriaceae bacterium]